MKSIKEKAEEVSQLPTRITNVTDPIRKQYFELGANYALGEILDKTSKCITVKDVYKAFLECVKQLKK